MKKKLMLMLCGMLPAIALAQGVIYIPVIGSGGSGGAVTNIAAGTAITFTTEGANTVINVSYIPQASSMVLSNIVGSGAITNVNTLTNNNNLAFAGHVGVASNFNVGGTITGNGTFVVDDLQITSLTNGRVKMDSSTNMVNVGSAEDQFLDNLVAGPGHATNWTKLDTNTILAAIGSGGLPAAPTYPVALYNINGTTSWRDPSLFRVFDGFDRFASTTYTTEGGVGTTTGPGVTGFASGSAIGAAQGYRNDFMSIKIAPTNAATPSARFAHGTFTPQHKWNTNFFYEVDLFLFGTGYSTLTNVLLSCGLLSSTSLTNHAGIFWKYNPQVTNAFVANCVGVTSAFWTNTVPGMMTNSWCKFGFYGSTNGVVFTTNGVACWTNSDSGTLSGGTALTACEFLAQSIQWPDQSGHTTSTNAQVYFDTKKCFEY